MVIAIWGRDGIGKSTLCDTLGLLFAQKGITVIIDTDLTQPTLPQRLNGQHYESDTSLGKAISGICLGDTGRYLHQHPKHKSLFYAGLTSKDEFLTYEIGLEADNLAQDFIEQCNEISDTVILDISGQRTDPFIPCALVNADKILTTFTPDVQGICWFTAIKPLLESMNAQGRVLPVAMMVEYHTVEVAEKASDSQFIAVLPHVREYRQMHDTGFSPIDGSTPSAKRYVKQIMQLYELLKGASKS